MAKVWFNFRHEHMIEHAAVSIEIREYSQLNKGEFTARISTSYSKVEGHRGVF